MTDCPTRRLLLAATDDTLAARLIPRLAQSGYRVSRATDAAAALRWSNLDIPRFALIETDLPQEGGCFVCRRIRSDPRTQNTWIMMLCASGEDAEHLSAFAAGADDVVSKSLNVDILLGRLLALERRSRDRTIEPPAEAIISKHGVTMDPIQFRASVDGSPLPLTPVEWRILRELLHRAGDVLTRSELAHASGPRDRRLSRRTIDAHIGNLRRKLAGRSVLLETVRSVGYRFGRTTR